VAARRRPSAPARGHLLVEEPRDVPGFAPRRLRIYTPPGYDGSRAVPLLVLFDGQNVFDDAPSFAGGWHAHTAVEKLARSRPRPIVVGVDHGGADRVAELSPWGRHGADARGEAFLGWVAHALVPELRGRYRVVDGPAGVLVGGSSMGGLAATYAHFRHPETFGGAMALSSSFWIGGGRILEWLQGVSTPWTSQVYLDCGSGEGGGRMAGLTEAVGKALRERGYGADKLRVRIDRRGGHDERSWRRRLPNALRFFYRGA